MATRSAGPVITPLSALIVIRPSSIPPRGPRSWRTSKQRSAGPVITPLSALNATRAPRASWPRPSTPFSADVRVSLYVRSRPVPPRPSALTGFSSNPCVQLCAAPSAYSWTTCWSGPGSDNSKDARKLLDHGPSFLEHARIFIVYGATKRCRRELSLANQRNRDMVPPPMTRAYKRRTTAKV